MVRRKFLRDVAAFIYTLAVTLSAGNGLLVWHIWKEDMKRLEANTFWYP